MKNKPSYAKSGKLTPKEARLLKALMGKLIGEEGMRVMQASGTTPSLLQRFVDEASQVASGVGSALTGGSFSEGYGEQEAADRARTAAGIAGDTDAFLAGAGAIGRQLFDDDLAQGRLETPGAEADFGGAFDRAFDRAKMTEDERRAANIESTIRRNKQNLRGEGITGAQLEKLGGTSDDLIRLLSEDKMKRTRPVTTASEAVTEERQRGLPSGSLYPEAVNDLRRSLGMTPLPNRP